MDLFLAILGSSVLASVVTVIFAFIQGRKQDTLKYIGEERTKWREKVRRIGEDIEKCQYGGTDGKNIDIYLNQLQMNINIYGKFDKSDYIHDAHIWEAIEVIQDADSEAVFETNKKLLLHYISLMLKEDWERSKAEVRGYSRLLGCVFLHIIVNVCFAFYYFGVLHLENIQLFLGIVLCNSLFIVGIRFGILDDMVSQADTRKDFSIKKIRKNERSFNRNTIIMSIVFIVYMIGGYAVLGPQLTNDVMQNVKYQTFDDRIIIFTNLDEDWVPNIEKKLEKRLGKKIEISHSEDSKEWIEKRNEDIEKIIKGVLIEKTCFYMIVIWCVFCAEVVLLCFAGGSNTINTKKRRLRRYIIHMKYMMCDEYYKNISEAVNILEEIMQMDETEWEDERWDALLAVEHRLLKDVQEQLERKYYTEKLQVDTLNHFQSVSIRMETANMIEDCIQKLKNMAKSRRFPFKKITVSEKKAEMSEIKQCIESIRQKGDIYSPI